MLGMAFLSRGSGGQAIERLSTKNMKVTKEGLDGNGPCSCRRRGLMASPETNRRKSPQRHRDTEIRQGRAIGNRKSGEAVLLIPVPPPCRTLCLCGELPLPVRVFA